MVLHLLGKKSWNVYNADNIERVKRDEAIAAAYEQEVERRTQEHDAAKRAALLRGLPPPPTPSPPPPPVYKTKRDETAVQAAAGGKSRKRTRRPGEDDTDRDIRYAREQNEAMGEARERLDGKRKSTSDAPLFDRNGHLDLFPVDEKEERRREKKEEADAEAKKRRQDIEDQYRVRFSSAAGKDGLNKKPWYSDKGGGLDQEEPSKDVWGRPDPARKARDAQRVTTSDPLAFMKKAQTQLKQAERDTKAWSEHRVREELELRKAGDRAKQDRRRRSRERRSRSRERRRPSLERRARSHDRKDSPERRKHGGDRREDRERRRRSRDRKDSRERRKHGHHHRRHQHARSVTPE